MQSSASKIRERLKKSNIDPNDISQEALYSLYERMRLMVNRADFTSSDPLLSTTASDKHSDEVFGVIIESRKSPVIEYVVRNFLDLTGLRVQIFAGEENYRFITELFAEEISSGKVHLTRLRVGVLDGKLYNKLLLSREFWDALIGENKALIFQTDSLVCPESDYKLEDFLKFDYIGSNWSSPRPSGLIIEAGAGGFSIRNIRLARMCLERFDPKFWKAGEDGYFAFHTELIGGLVAAWDDSAAFGTQWKFQYRSFGCHKLECLAPEARERFFLYCPEARFILNNGYHSQGTAG